MSRENTGTYAAPNGTTAVPGSVITSDQFNNFVTDIGSEVTASATRAQLLDVGGAVNSGGVGSAYSVVLNQPLIALQNGLLIGFRPAVTNTGPCTLTITGGQAGATALGTVPLRAVSGQDLSTGDLPTGSPVVVIYSAASFSKSMTATLTASSNQATNVSDVTGVAVGQTITSTSAGIPPGTTITAITGTTLTLSAPFAGTSTGAASCLITGPEALIVNGSLAATASRLGLSGGTSFLALAANTTLGAAHKGKLLFVSGSPTLTFDRPATLGAGWNTYLRNDGSGDIPLTVKQLGAFTASVTNGSNQVTNVSSTTGLAVGQVLSGSIATGLSVAAVTGSNVVGLSSATGVAVGSAVIGAQPSLAAGTTVTALTPNLAFTGATTAGSNLLTAVAPASLQRIPVGALITGGSFPAGTAVIGVNTATNTLVMSAAATAGASGVSFTAPAGTATLSNAYNGMTTNARGLQFITGFNPGTTITAISGSTVTASAAWTGATSASASFTTTGDLVDGLQGYVLYPGETRLFSCDGVAIRSAVLEPGTKTFTASGSFVVPPGITALYVRAVGAGGGGAGSSGQPAGGGGGGGVTIERCLTPLPPPGSTQYASIGAGGIGGPSASAGASAVGGYGGNTSLGDYLSAYGGAPGGLASGNTNYLGGGGAGSAGSPTLSAPSTGGNPTIATSSALNTVGSGGASAPGSVGVGGFAEWGGGGGGSANTNVGDGGAGGGSMFGGGGGGAGGTAGGAGGSGGAAGSYATGGGGAGGAPTGAAGGAGANATNGYGASGGGGGGSNGGTSNFNGGNGGAPGGGGGGAAGSGTNSFGGNGGRGELRIWWW